MSMFRTPEALTRNCQGGQEAARYDTPFLKSGRFFQDTWSRPPFSCKPAQDPVFPGFADRWESKAECRDYNTEEWQFYNLLPAYASSVLMPRQKAVLSWCCSLLSPEGGLHFLLPRICAHTEEQQEWTYQIQARTDLLRTELFRKLYRFHFQKMILCIKSFQKPFLSPRYEIWHKISINRLIIIIK